MNEFPSCHPSPQLLLPLRLLLLLLLLSSKSNATSPHRRRYGNVAVADAAFNPSLLVLIQRHHRLIKTRNILHYERNNDGTTDKWRLTRRFTACFSSTASKDEIPHRTASFFQPPTSTTSSSKESSTLRNPIFHHTNAVSKSFPVPHPNLWTRSLIGSSSSSSPSCHGHSSFLLPMSLASIISPSSQIINDVRIEFTNPVVGARQLLVNCGIISHDESHYGTTEEIIDTMDHLANVLSYFQSIVSLAWSANNNNDGDEKAEECSKNSNNNSHHQVPCVARIVSTIGRVGTKCPRWHADHVPVRLIMSLVGPGCEYVHEESVDYGGSCRDVHYGEIGKDYHWNNESPNTVGRQLKVIVNRYALNNLDEEDTMKANNIIVKTIAVKTIALPSSTHQPSMPLMSNQAYERSKLISTIKQAKEGEAVMLMGKGWEEGIGEDNKDTSVEEQKTNIHYHDHAILAAVHRSPKLRPNQKRILLTVDLAKT